jgi:hypothetical protein
VEAVPLVVPEDATMGLTPYSAATEMPLGLWSFAGGDEQRCGGVGADVIGVEYLLIVVGDLSGELADAALVGDPLVPGADGG